MTTVTTRLTRLAALVLIVGVVLALLYLAGIFGGGKGIANAALIETPPSEIGEAVSVEAEEGALAPNFELSDFSGRRHRLSDYRGSAVYLNFWASWCDPCIEELPSIDGLEEKYEGRLTVITINRAQSLGQAQSFLRDLSNDDGSKGISFTVDGMDPDETVYRAYRGFGMPVSVFIDAAGVVTMIHNGFMTAQEMEEAVLEALAMEGG